MNCRGAPGDVAFSRSLEASPQFFVEWAVKFAMPEHCTSTRTQYASTQWSNDH